MPPARAAPTFSGQFFVIPAADKPSGGRLPFGFYAPLQFASHNLATVGASLGYSVNDWRGMRHVFALLVVLQTGMTASARAQADRVDAGSFSIEQQGHRVGREQFSLRKAPAPDGSALELRSESVSGDRRIAVQLTTDSLGSPVRYSLEIREGTKVTVRAGGQRLRSRFTTQTVRATGESVREYLLVPGLIVLEADFYQQLAFVLRGRALVVGRTVEVPALSLLENALRQLRLSLESRADSVIIAGAATPALRWRLEDGTGIVRTLWSDADGRMLRVMIPSKSIDVVRDAVPK